MILNILIKDINASLNCGEDDVFNRALAKLNKTHLPIKPLSFSVYKRSVDARKRDNILLVYSVLCSCEASDDFDISEITDKGFSVIERPSIDIKIGNKKMQKRPVVVGMGPAGIFCALILAENGYRPILIERGDDVDTRLRAKDNFYKTHVLDEESNVQFGAGGAGTFSDGKLVTRINDKATSYVLKTLHELGAPDDILTRAKPHVGTDLLINVVKNAAEKITKLGGEIRYRTRLDDIDFYSDGSVKSITLNNTEKLECGPLVLALGHSARDTYQMLMSKDLIIEPKSFSIGVRIEHLRSDIDHAMYGKAADLGILGPAEYTLSHNTKQRGVYTFCMCPGGEVVAATSESGSVVVNGMSNYKRDGANSNSAVAVSIFGDDFGNTPKKAIEFQRSFEKLAYRMGGGGYAAPICTLADFYSKTKGRSPDKVKPTYMNGENCRLVNFSEFLPGFMYDSLSDGIAAFDKKIKGFASDSAVLSAFETRTSAPVRIIRGEDRCAISHNDLYPCGEGAGYAGGITSAALDGLKTALSIIEKYSPLD